MHEISPFKTLRQAMDMFIPLAILALWIVLQIWVLPRFGIRT